MNKISMSTGAFLLLLASHDVFGAVSSQIQVNVESILGTCNEAAQACGKLYGDVFNATVQPIAASCNSVSSGCGTDLCRHKVDSTIVDQAKFSINPEYEEIDGVIKAKITGSFSFSHDDTTATSCQWPGTYDDVKLVAKETWLAAKCTEAVTKICQL